MFVDGDRRIRGLTQQQDHRVSDDELCQREFLQGDRQECLSHIEADPLTHNSVCPTSEAVWRPRQQVWRGEPLQVGATAAETHAETAAAPQRDCRVTRDDLGEHARQ
jgi:hypothetical protein